ncbi:DUF3159 domain-containing protein [Streptomyces sp. NPDC057950]|uniref:DUF3159 domain-containing protein n=1 Tax=Streptomyces sp. NPDC057950 TaxID=3346288 RepID=UPI0036E0AE0D
MDTADTPTTPTPTADPRQRPAPSPRAGWTAKLSGVLVAAAPTVAFLGANAASSLDAGLIAAGATAGATLAWRLLRKERLRQALAGLLVVGVCAGAAAITGEARGFFLLPALIPFVVLAVCLGSILIGRPLTGVILNRVSGGHANWREVPRLRRVYRNSTWVCVAVNVVNAALQVIYYRADEPLVLGMVHIATGPVFAAIIAATIAFARRAMPARGPAA